MEEIDKPEVVTTEEEVDQTIKTDQTPSNKTEVKRGVFKEISDNKKILIVLLGALILFASSYFIRRNMMVNTFIKQGNVAMNAGRYDEAIASFKGALNIKQDQGISNSIALAETKIASANAKVIADKAEADHIEAEKCERQVEMNKFR